MAGSSKTIANNRSTRTAGGNAKGRKAKRGDGGISPPTAYSSGGVYTGPSINGGPRGQTRFSHTEFVADVGGTINGIVNVLTINPAATSTFPWLSRIAQGFELYRFKRLRIDYTPSVSTTSAGIVVGAFEFDGNDALPTSKQQLSAMDGSRRVNVWGKQSFPMACPAGWYYTGTVVTPGSTGDVRLTDVARFILGVFGTAVVMSPGELSVSYDVEFAKPDMGINYASERVTFSSSSLANLSGSHVDIGDDIFDASSPSSGTLNLNVKLSGNYLFNFVTTATASSPVGSVFASFNLTRAGSTSSIGNESSTSYVSAGATFYGITTFWGNFAVGDVITLVAATAITSLMINRGRIATYKAIGE